MIVGEIIVRPEQEAKIRMKLRQKNMLLPDFVSEFIYVSETSKSISTCYEYMKDLLLFFEFLIKERKVLVSDTKDITTDDLNRLTERDFVDFMNYLSFYKKTYQSRTGKEIVQSYKNQPEGKNRKLATLRVFFDYLFQREHIEKDITKRVEMKVRKRVKIKNRLSDKEVRLFFETIKQDVNVESSHAGAYHNKTKYRDYVIAILFAYCGIRVSELAQLNVDDVFKEEHALIVTRKGGNEQGIPIPDEIYELVVDYVEIRKKVTDVQKEDENALFLSLQGKRIHPRTIRNMLDKYRKRAGLSIKITPHVFRRTFGTNHYNTFKDMYLTALILGHSSAETTRKYYADPNEDRVKKSMSGFNYN